MKIMIICLSMHSGGTERVVANLSNHLSTKNNVILTTIIKDKNQYELNKNIEQLTIDKINYSKMSQLKKKIMKVSIKRIIKLKKIIISKKPNIILCFLPLPSFYLMILKKTNKQIKKIPVILSERGNPNITFKNKFLYKIMKNLYSNANGFVFQTKEASKFYNNIIKCKQTVIGNPLNEKFIKEEISKSRTKTIVSVGRLEPQKNNILLLEAFLEVHKKYPEYQLLFYGDGSKRNYLTEYIESKKMQKYIKIMGNSNMLYNDIYDCGLFVLTSNFEGMPNALMEAMALGLPCISTDCPVGGPKLLINNNKNGILIEVNNKEQLIKSIIKIIEKKDFTKKISNNALLIGKKYHPNTINKKWEDFIIKIAKTKNK